MRRNKPGVMPSNKVNLQKRKSQILLIDFTSRLVYSSQPGQEALSLRTEQRISQGQRPPRTERARCQFNGRQATDVSTHRQFQGQLGPSAAPVAARRQPEYSRLCQQSSHSPGDHLQPCACCYSAFGGGHGHSFARLE